LFQGLPDVLFRDGTMIVGGVTIQLETQSRDDVIAAGRHLEDLEIFVGQRSRLHPGPGWDIVLQILRQDLALVRAELVGRGIALNVGPLG
jgi:hypothetical protein